MKNPVKIYLIYKRALGAFNLFFFLYEQTSHMRKFESKHISLSLSICKKMTGSLPWPSPGSLKISRPE